MIWRFEVWEPGQKIFREKKTALFLVMPDNDPSFNFLISMFYTTMFDVLIHTADHECGGALPIHVRLWADEFYAGPKPSKTESLMGTIRGRNISIVPILQSIAQIKALFQQDKWEIFVENCAVTIYMGSGPGAKSTHKYISELLGEMTIDVRNDGRTFGGTRKLQYSKPETGEKSDDSCGGQTNEPKELSDLYRRSVSYF